MSEKLCLNWNDFQENVNAAFGSLREDNDFADVTLACEDGEQVEAHKFLLTAASPFFQNLLLTSTHPHPIIYMRGVDSAVLLAIVDFLYCGEVELDPEYLEPFLAIAQELKLEGLLKQSGNDVKTEKLSKSKPTTMHQIRKKLISVESDDKEMLTPAAKAELLANYNQLQPLVKLGHMEISMEDDIFPSEEGNISDSIQVYGDHQELDKTVKSMMQRNKDSVGLYKHAYVCNICGKEGQQTTIKGHIEAKHLEGITIPCNICEKQFRSRANLRAHKRNNHSASE